MDLSRYIVVEGSPGSGKGDLAARLVDHLSARPVRDEPLANPFLADFLKDRKKYAFQAQLFFLLSRFRQQRDMAQLNLFHQGTVGDYLFARDRIWAALCLSEAELALYDQMFHLLLERAPRPDLVIYLSARVDTLWRRLKRRAGKEPPAFGLDFLTSLGEAYNHYFFHYTEAPLLVVNTNDVDLIHEQDHFLHLVKEIERHKKGVKHYVPLGAGSPGSAGSFLNR
jgi:deoxyadenosine/deoxycytidine kinase